MKILSFSLIFSLFLLVGFQAQAQADSQKMEKQAAKKVKDKDKKDMKARLTQTEPKKDKVELKSKKDNAKKEHKSDEASEDGERPRLEPKQTTKGNGDNMKQKEVKEKAKGEGKGHAYGKNKGDMSGKEFGKARAEEAKVTNQKKTIETKVSMDKAEESIKKAYDRLDQKQVEFKKDLDSGKITQADYDSKTEQVNKALSHMAELQKKILAGRLQIKE